ncbi:hypothetical protein DNTS_013948 [Danionella cerebrum]|uniref:Uncharacterized protein n=1 Tax=Danionella cerebrum TaxID=2873325 RepID=A0A553MUK2_9TELE|nr:hypothetical protein DNTS_013948 [Danionella translucida]
MFSFTILHQDLTQCERKALLLTMKLALAFILLFTAFTRRIWGHDFKEQRCIRDQNPHEMNVLESDLQTVMERVRGALGLQQVFSLMGKRSSARSKVTRRRQKFQTFVGLMGK